MSKEPTPMQISEALKLIEDALKDVKIKRPPYPDPHDVRVQKASNWLFAVANERMQIEGRYMEGILIMLAAEILQRGELNREKNPILNVVKEWFAKGCPPI